MASSSSALPDYELFALPHQQELLQWVKKDNRRMLHAMFYVNDLARSIRFYTESFGMRVLRIIDYPQVRSPDYTVGFTEAFVGYGPEESSFVFRMRCQYGPKWYERGTGFGHFAISSPNVEKLKIIERNGTSVIRELGSVKGGPEIKAFVYDPDNYPIELIQRESTSESICRIMLRTGDLEPLIEFYEKAMGMRLLRKVDVPAFKHTFAMMGYGEEENSIVLELTYNYMVTMNTNGNAYIQVVIGTDDVYKSAEVAKMVREELGFDDMHRKIESRPEFRGDVIKFTDTTNWIIMMVNNKEFLKELGEKKTLHLHTKISKKLTSRYRTQEARSLFE